MKAYLEILKEVYETGSLRPSRTGVDCISKFGLQFRHDLGNGFPLLTTKKINYRSVLHELFWFISGNTNIDYLRNRGVNIWNLWADNKGNLGPIYGKQWRSWGNIFNNTDQLQKAIDTIKKDKFSRRMIVSSWNVSDLNIMALPPCHLLYQFYVDQYDRLSLQLYQRSSDLFIGLPFNIASYSFLTHFIADLCDLDVGELIISIGDAHIYSTHRDQVEKQLMREPRKLPNIRLNSNHTDIGQFNIKSVSVLEYDPQPHIRAEVIP